MTRVPYSGFRFVFALVNGALWFGIAFVFTTPVASGMIGAGRTSSMALTSAAVTVAFLTSLFGVPGALGGFLEEAERGRFSLPPETKRGPGTLGSVWLHAVTRAVIAAGATAVIVKWLANRYPLAARLHLFLAFVAAIIGALQALWLASPVTLGDLRGATTRGPTPSRAYFLARFAIPQAAGNGLATAMVAIAVFPKTGGMTAIDVATDAGGTVAIIYLMMIAFGGTLAKIDHRFGVAGPLPGVTPPPWIARIALTLAAGGLGAGLGFALALAWSDGVPLAPFFVWKLALGSLSAGVGAWQAARWKLAALA